eukprot:5835851-Pleurochrysis_carterae.AAC.1
MQVKPSRSLRLRLQPQCASQASSHIKPPACVVSFASPECEDAILPKRDGRDNGRNLPAQEGHVHLPCNISDFPKAQTQRGGDRGRKNRMASQTQSSDKAGVRDLAAPLSPGMR